MSSNDLDSGNSSASPPALSVRHPIRHRGPGHQILRYGSYGRVTLLFPEVQRHVCFLGYSGRELLAVSLSEFDPDRTLGSLLERDSLQTLVRHGRAKHGTCPGPPALPGVLLPSGIFYRPERNNILPAGTER
jgi:hypothetical protein